NFVHTLFSCLFFLYLHRHHPDLHSFPTRRSSDLSQRARARGPARHRGRFRAEDFALTSYPIGTPGVAWGDSERAQWLSRQRKLRDRKSTRLNSSHSQISYAVFCLKKKKI